MIPILSNIIAKIGLTLLTQSVVSHVSVYTLQALAKKSTNTLDDKIVATIAEALSVKID